MSFRNLWRVILCFALSTVSAAGTVRAELPQFEAPLANFKPRESFTEEERDKAQALAFYGMAREAEARGDSIDALKWYLRTLRYDTSCVPAARSAMRLAIRLRRPDQAMEAVLRIPECRDEDRLPMRYMALHLTRQGRWEEAIDVYERTMGLRPHTPTSEEDVLMMMEMARLSHLVEDNEKAASYFTEVLKALESPRKHNLSPKVRRDLLGEDGATYQLIGTCFLAAGELQAARAVFKKAEEEVPDGGRADYHAALIHHHEGQHEKALAELDVAFKSNATEEGIRPFLLLEEILNDLGRGEELVKYLATLQESQPKNTALTYFLADKLFQANEYDRAEPLYVSLVEQAPTSTAYQHLLEIYLSRFDYGEAAGILAAVAEKTGTLDALEESLELVTGSPEAVDAILAQGRESLQGSNDSGPSRTLAAALTALAAERFEAARELMNSVIDSSPDRAENLLLIWGLELLSADRPKEAVEVLHNGAVREGMSDSQRGVFYYYLAAALEMDGQTEAALAAAREAVKLSEDSAPFHVRVAWVLYHADRKTEAAKEYRALIDRFGKKYESDQARNAVRQARMVLSTLCVAEHRVDEAVEWLEQVLDEYPDDPGALNDLGYLWADENQHLGRAHKMIERAVSAEPENAAYRDSLGWVLYRRGQYEQAIAELSKAVELDPDPVVLEHLGDAYSKTSQFDQAKATWERSAARFEETGLKEEAARVRKKLAEQH